MDMKVLACVCCDIPHPTAAVVIFCIPKGISIYNLSNTGCKAGIVLGNENRVDVHFVSCHCGWLTL